MTRIGVGASSSVDDGGQRTLGSRCSPVPLLRHPTPLGEHAVEFVRLRLDSAQTVGRRQLPSFAVSPAYDPADLIDAQTVAELLGLSSRGAGSVYRSRYDDFGGTGSTVTHS